MKPKAGSLLRLTGLINPLLSVYNFRRPMELLSAVESTLQGDITFVLTDSLRSATPSAVLTGLPVTHLERHLLVDVPHAELLQEALVLAPEEADVRDVIEDHGQPLQPQPEGPADPVLSSGCSGDSRRDRGLKGTRGHRSIPLLTRTGPQRRRAEARCAYTVDIYHELIKNVCPKMSMYYDTTL